ncbi:hypothetical protein CR513_26988, partial [Mucuna pruriens]
MDKTPEATRHLISKMASNTQQFRIRGASQPWMVNEIGVVDNLRLENQLTELTSLHPTDMCPTLQETESDHLENVGAIGGYQYGRQLYQSRPFDNQQIGKQLFRPGPSQGPYVAQTLGPALNIPQGQPSY